jgi:hypothetical protein
MSERVIFTKEEAWTKCLAALELGDENHYCSLEGDHSGDHTNGLKTWGNLQATWYTLERV